MGSKFPGDWNGQQIPGGFGMGSKFPGDLEWIQTSARNRKRDRSTMLGI